MSRFFPRETIVTILINEYTDVNRYFYDYLTEVAYFNKNHRLHIIFNDMTKMIQFPLIKEIIHNLSLRRQVTFNYTISTDTIPPDLSFVNDKGIIVSLLVRDVQNISTNITNINNLNLRINMKGEDGLKTTLDTLTAFYKKIGRVIPFEIEDVIGCCDSTIREDVNYIISHDDELTYRTYLLQSLTRMMNKRMFNNIITIDIRGYVYNEDICCGSIFDEYYSYLTNIINSDKSNHNCVAYNFCNKLLCGKEEWCLYKITEFDTLRDYIQRM